MQKFFITLFMMSFLYSCRKEAHSLHPAATVSRIEMTCGDMPLMSSITTIPNRTDVYQFGGRAGNYFGLIADFPVTPSGTLQLRFGNIITSDYFLTQDDMARLLVTGKKPMGSLGSFTSFPALAQDCAEIAYTDEHGKRWCSTVLTEYTENGSLHNTAHLPEDGSYVQIDSAVMHESTQGLNPLYEVHGMVNATLYEVNGPDHQPLTGHFSGIMGIQ